MQSFPESEQNIFKNYKFIPIELLVEADWNYKENDEFLQEQLVNNIKRNGQIATCNVRDLPTGYFEVVDGNHRLKAFLVLGQSYVICYDHGDITLAEAKRISIEKNETRFQSDDKKLSAIIEELVSVMGEENLKPTLPFTSEEFDDLLDSLSSDIESMMDNDDDASDLLNRTTFDEGLVEEDEFDEEPPIEPVTKVGDVYELNGHRFICGDSTNSNDVAKLMQGEKAHLLYTDPPYNVKYTAFNKSRNEDAKDWGDDYSSEWTDDMGDEAYKKFLIDFLKLAKENSIEWAHYYVWHATTFVQDVINAFIANGIPYDKVPIQWVKQNAPLSRTRYWRITEPCIFGGKGAINGVGAGARWFGKIGEVNAWHVSKEYSGRYIHPTQKPLALSARAINNSSQDGEIVLDMFLGSGSTLISCDIMGRVCRGLELEPKFADLIVLRYMKYCEDRGKTCVVKLNGTVIGKSHFNYPEKDVRTVDTYEYSEDK